MSTKAAFEAVDKKNDRLLAAHIEEERRQNRIMRKVCECAYRKHHGFYDIRCMHHSRQRKFIPTLQLFQSRQCLNTDCPVFNENE
jgi:hypothetical protein